MASTPNDISPASAQIFDRQRVRMHRERSAHDFSAHNFLHQRAMVDIVDRLETATRSFDRALFIGAGNVEKLMTPTCKVGDIVHMDLATTRINAAKNAVAGDEEALPFANGSFDLVVSVLTLHCVNDFIGALVQARMVLKPDGLFIAAIFGEGTLASLRTALRRAEIEQSGALASRIAPFAAIQDFGQALSRAGFALPVTDIDTVRVSYREPIRLLKDLRGIGETNPLAGRIDPLRRATFFSALSNFQSEGSEEIFNIVYVTGWAPDESQQKPLKPGSAKTSLADAVINSQRS